MPNVPCNNDKEMTEIDQPLLAFFYLCVAILSFFPLSDSRKKRDGGGGYVERDIAMGNWLLHAIDTAEKSDEYDCFWVIIK